MSVVDRTKGTVFNVLGSRPVTSVKRLFLPAAARRHAIVGSARLWKMKREFQIAFLKNHGLEPSSLLLDLGCGTLRGGVPMIEFLDVGHYTGVDVRPESMVEAIKELDESGLEPKQPNLICVRDVSQLRLEERFDMIWAFSVLIHLSDDRLRGVLHFVSDHLTDDGRFFANVNIGAGTDGKWDLFPVVERSLDFYEAAAARAGLAVEDIGSIFELGHRSGVESHDSGRMLRFRRANV